MIYWLKYRTKDGTEGYFRDCVTFSYIKEAYTPYTTFKAVVYGNTLPDDIAEIDLNVEGYDVHLGFIDSYKVINQNGVRRGIISSRGYTALLTENQLPPGMYTNMTFNRLFDEYFTLPNIQHESNTESSYIYVNKGASMWDGAANLTYKLTGNYPYIKGNNTVMMTIPEKSREITVKSENIYSYGTDICTRRMVSNYNMADMGGEYGTFSAVSEEAIARGLIRNRHFDLDQRFLSNPESACDYRIMLAERGYKRHFFTVNGYYGEDLNDYITTDTLGKRRINRVRVTGNKNGIFTEFSVYDTT